MSGIFNVNVLEREEPFHAFRALDIEGLSVGGYPGRGCQN